MVAVLLCVAAWWMATAGDDDVAPVVRSTGPQASARMDPAPRAAVVVVEEQGDGDAGPGQERRDAVPTLGRVQVFAWQLSRSPLPAEAKVFIRSLRPGERFANLEPGGWRSSDREDGEHGSSFHFDGIEFGARLLFRVAADAVEADALGMPWTICVQGPRSVETMMLFVETFPGYRLSVPSFRTGLVDADGVPVKERSLRFDDGSMHLRPTFTDADGVAWVSVGPGGARNTARPWISRTVDGRSCCRFLPALEAATGSVVEVAHFVVGEHTVLCEGIVVDERGAPVPGATVSIEGLREVGLGVQEWRELDVDRVYCDKSGAFAFSGAVMRNLRCRVVKSGFTRAHPVPFTLGERGLRLVIERGGSLFASVAEDDAEFGNVAMWLERALPSGKVVSSYRARMSVDGIGSWSDVPAGFYNFVMVFECIGLVRFPTVEVHRVSGVEIRAGERSEPATLAELPYRKDPRLWVDLRLRDPLSKRTRARFYVDVVDADTMKPVIAMRSRREPSRYLVRRPSVGARLELRVQGYRAVPIASGVTGMVDISLTKI